MKALILAAGTGSRLKPYTDNCPKALVSLAGKPLLEYQLATLKECGVVDVTLISGYLSDQFRAFPVNLKTNPDYEESNMLHSLMCAKEAFMDDEDLIICYGDIIYQPDILNQLINSPGDIVVSADRNWYDLWTLRMEEPLLDAESFEFESDTKRLVSLGKPITRREDAQAQYIGLIKVKSNAFTSVVSAYEKLGITKTKNMYMTDFIQYLINTNLDVRVSTHDRGWLEVDTTEDLDSYQNLIRSGKFQQLGYRF